MPTPASEGRREDEAGASLLDGAPHDARLDAGRDGDDEPRDRAVAVPREIEEQDRPQGAAFDQALEAPREGLGTDARATRVRSLLVTGSLSPPYLTGLSERLLKLLPEAEWANMEGAGHFMHREAPAEFCGVVERFLDR